MQFPRSIKLIGKPDFSDAFMQELREQEGDLPLADFCYEGFLDDEFTYLEFDSVESTDEGCHVRVTCKYRERVATGCADLTIPRNEGKLFIDFQLEADCPEASMEIDQAESIVTGPREFDH